MITDQIRGIVRDALAEDIASGDVTSLSIVPSSTGLMGEFLTKAPGVIAGLGVVGEVFAQVEGEIVFRPLAREGSVVCVGDVAARVEGSGPGILSAERVALNFLQRMSGIATITRRYVEAVAGTRATILDTRKTAPGLRVLDKLAVKLGGGSNHRMGLFDMVLIKDNHIRAAGSIRRAVRLARERSDDLLIEVEVESLEQLDEALGLGVDRVMLDNMGLDAMREAVRRARGKVELEASGGIKLEDVGAVAATGVDFVSIGSLTHSVTALDISLEITQVRPGQQGEGT